MFFLAHTNTHPTKSKKDSRSVFQIFPLLGKWGALSISGDSTPIGFQYDDVNKVYESLMKKGFTSLEVFPGPTIQIASYGSNSFSWSDYFSDYSKTSNLDSDSYKILCQDGQKRRTINIVFQGNKFILLDNENGELITFLSCLNEELQEDFISLFEKYHIFK